jgi:hypothetical protein
MTKKDLSGALDELSKFDHVVFRLSGENPMEFIELLRIYGLLPKFRNRKYSASFWTMDSHHLGKYEARAARHFDQIFVAHKNYLELFPKGSSHHLPCSFSLVPEAEIEHYFENGSLSGQYFSTKGVCAPFAAYPWQKRNRYYLEALWAAEELRLPHFFGTVRGGDTPNQGLIERILSFDVVFNLSLSEDLNMRNFEALALNKILLTNRVSDHSLLSNFESNIIFVDPANHDIKKHMSLALEAKPQDISKAFLAQHSIRARLEELVSILLNVESIHLETGVAEIQKGHEPDNKIPNQTLFVREHTPELLIARSGIPSATQLRGLVKSNRLLGKSLGILLAFWIASLASHILSRLVRHASWLRAYSRAVAAISRASRTPLFGKP